MCIETEGYQEYSFPRLFVPWNIRSHDGTFNSTQHKYRGKKLKGVSLKTDRTTAQQTAQLEGDDNVHACTTARPHRRPHSNAAEKFSYLFMRISTTFCKQFDHCLYPIHYVDPFINQMKIKNELMNC